MSTQDESIKAAIKDGTKASDEALIKIGRCAVKLVRAQEVLEAKSKEVFERQELCTKAPFPVAEDIRRTMKAMAELSELVDEAKTLLSNLVSVTQALLDE